MHPNHVLKDIQNSNDLQQALYKGIFIKNKSNYLFWLLDLQNGKQILVKGIPNNTDILVQGYVNIDHEN